MKGECAVRMTALRLRDFRGYRQVSLHPPEGVTVLVGQNGAGKTNLLEAVHLCCLGRSHRTSFDREMIRRGEETAAVQLTAGEFKMRSGARVPIPRGKEAAARAAFRGWLDAHNGT